MSAVTESEAKDELRTTLVELFNRHKVDPEIIDGRKTYLIRCKAGEFRARLPFHRSGGAAGAGQNERAVGVSKEATDGLLMIEGTASSTSEDWYGTEMSPSCLLGMQAQFNLGIGLFPSHGSWFAGLEWDQEMGRTTEAAIETMAMPPDGEDPEMGPGYCLRIKGGLDAENPKCQDLARRLGKGQKIGMSIGGWFTEVRYIMDEDEEEIERIIVEKVELDHLAIVRNPANPDCLDLKLLRSVASQAFRAKRAPEARAVPAATPPVLSTRSEEPAATEPEIRGTTPFADLPTAPEETAWDWSTKNQDEILGESGDNWAAYKKANFWMDPEGDPKTKACYKLGFALMVDGKLQAVWNGVSAAMGALNGARGGVDIPDADREAVYGHIKKYYKKFDKEVPELKGTPAPETAPETAPAENNSADPGIADDRSTGEISNTTETQMTEADIRNLIQAELATRTKLETENAELRAKVLNLESRSNQSVRKGMGAAVANHRTVSTSVMEQLCTRAKTEIPDSDSICDLIRSRQRGLDLVGRTKTSGKDGEDLRSFCNDAPDFLREILGEAGENGMLRQWRREMHDLMD